MKILPINFYTTKNYSVSYKKSPHFEGVFDSFKRAKSPINDEVETIFTTAKFLKKSASQYYNIAKKSVQKGANNDYKMYTVYDKKNSEKMLFYDVDPITDMPAAIEHIKPLDGMKTTKIIELYQGLNSYRIQDFSFKDIIHDAFLSEKTLITFEEKDLSHNKSQEYSFAKEGFVFKDMKIENNDKICTRAFSYNSKNSNSATYAKLNSQGNYDIYKKINGLWQKVATKDAINPDSF